MLEWLWLIIGVVLLAAVFVDSFYTALWVTGGAGPLTGYLTSRSWKVITLLGWQRYRRARTLFGPASLAATLVLWMTLLWAGWVFVFSFEAESVLAVADKQPADLVARIYYVGYGVFTMGNGDYAPDGGVWQLLTVLVNATGFALVTLAITYILSVLSPVVSKRVLANNIRSLGSTSGQLLETAWNGEDFSDLNLPLERISYELTRLAQQHTAYPLLHYYHARTASDSLPLAVGTLDEVMRVVRSSISRPQRPNPVVLANTRAAIEAYLAAVPPSFKQPSGKAPPGPDIERLQQAGIPIDAESLREEIATSENHRRMLLSLVRTEGWENWQV